VASSFPESFPPAHTSIADSARVIGRVELGPRAYLAQGAILRGDARNSGALRVGAASMVLENSVLWGSPERPCSVGEKTVFGHRALVIGATIGNLCELGNGVIILEGAKLGEGCVLGEGTLIPPGMQVEPASVVVGRPGRVIRRDDPRDRDMIARMRGGDLSLPGVPTVATGPSTATRVAPESSKSEQHMGTLYAYRDKTPSVDPSAFLFDSCEVTGDVVIGPDCIIGAGVRIIGDSHGPVRIGRGVQILENSVLHLLPDNQLILEDDVVIGPGCMIHGCKIGAGSVIEPGANISDNSVLGRGCVVKAGSMVKQRSEFPDFAVIEGFPAKEVERGTAAPSRPAWALNSADLSSLIRVD
jgi:carbonic anhydrase/acetyltransferase-like protein (isoleucine patch superfamily)